MKFSVLMSIYCKESPKYFDRAMRSIWDEQAIKPDEIILVQDGRLTDELYLVTSQWQEKLSNSFKTVLLQSPQPAIPILSILISIMDFSPIKIFF